MKANTITRQQFMLSGLLARDPEARQLHTRHLQVLEQVCASDTPSTAGLIADAVAVSLSQLSRLLGRLEECGLVTRTPNRPAQIAATKQGAALIERIDRYAAACRLPDRAA